MDRVKTIGLVGGVASGKSSVAEMLVELGAGLLDADRTGHQLLVGDPEVREAIMLRWGLSVFREDGTPNRSAIAEKVFASFSAAEDRKFLEDLLHPRIGQRLQTESARYAAEGWPAAVLDAPLLLEAGWDPLCDIILMVDAPRDLRLSRAAKRGWSEAKFSSREAAQWPVERKRQSADVVLDNSGSEDELREAVRAFWRQYIDD